MIELVAPESLGDQQRHERDIALKRAIETGARGLTPDEMYILRRLASVIAQDPAAASGYGGCFVSLPVSEFAVHAGLTQKVAHRRLDIAANSLYDRRVELTFAGETTRFVWASSRLVGTEVLDMSFSQSFVRAILYTEGMGREPAALIPSAETILAAVEAGAGVFGQRGLEVTIRSSLMSRKKRPKDMSYDTMCKRIGKQLRVGLGRDQILDTFEVFVQTSRWKGKTDPKYYRYTHKDLREFRVEVMTFIRDHSIPAD